MIDNENLYRLCIIRTPGVGIKTFYTLINTYGSAEQAIQRDKRTFTSPEEIKREIDCIFNLGMTYLFFDDYRYPNDLKQIDNPPPILIVKGNIDLLKRSSLAIVGGRQASLAGQKWARCLAYDLSRHGFSIVSGFARGIDTATHWGAIKHGTVAVLAAGCDVIYPRENKKLYDEICEKGLIIAEMPPGVTPQPTFFPRRNRIIVGMCEGVILVEAALQSGSMITGRLAIENNREVFAVPGFPMDLRVRGCHKLIKEGAYLCEGVDDVLEVIGSKSKLVLPGNETISASQPTKLSHETDITAEVQRVLNLLSYGGTSHDELLSSVDLTSAELSTILLDLELTGKIIKRGQQLHLA